MKKFCWSIIALCVLTSNVFAEPQLRNIWQKITRKNRVRPASVIPLRDIPIARPPSVELPPLRRTPPLQRAQSMDVLTRNNNQLLQPLERSQAIAERTYPLQRSHSSIQLNQEAGAVVPYSSHLFFEQNANHPPKKPILGKNFAINSILALSAVHGAKDVVNGVEKVYTSLKEMSSKTNTSTTTEKAQAIITTTAITNATKASTAAAVTVASTTSETYTTEGSMVVTAASTTTTKRPSDTLNPNSKLGQWAQRNVKNGSSFNFFEKKQNDYIPKAYETSEAKIFAIPAPAVIAVFTATTAGTGTGTTKTTTTLAPTTKAATTTTTAATPTAAATTTTAATPSTTSTSTTITTAKTTLRSRMGIPSNAVLGMCISIIF